MRKRNVAVLGLLSIFPLLAIPKGNAKWARPPRIPSERLIRNLSAGVKAAPNDPDGYYKLGRVYYAAFISPDDRVTGYETDPRYSQNSYVALPHQPGHNYFLPAQSPPKNPQEKEIQLNLALENLRHAVSQKPDDALYHLTLASACEDAIPMAIRQSKNTAPTGLPTPVKSDGASHPLFDANALRSESVAEYLRAFDLGLPTDAKGKRGMMDESFLSEEAGQGYLRVLKRDPEAAKKTVDTARVCRGLATLGNIKGRGITPIVFSMHAKATLSDAVETHRTVRFDLDGTGRPQRYSWLKTDTGILVWDPDGTGQITSGRQLFGSVSWWIFWKDGYQALDALDDNRDGRLSGSELKGIGVWFDRNGDGVCEPGEVVSAVSLGIKSISCRSTGVEDGALSSRTGIEVQNGETFESWDWVATPIGERKRGQK